MPCQCGSNGVCDSLVSGGEEVSGQLQPQGMHVGGSFASSVQLREIARENNPGQSGWSDPGKGALTFFDSNCAAKKNNTSGIMLSLHPPLKSRLLRPLSGVVRQRRLAAPSALQEVTGMKEASLLAAAKNEL